MCAKYLILLILVVSIAELYLEVTRIEVESSPRPQCGQKDVNKKFPVTTSGIEPTTSRFVG